MGNKKESCLKGVPCIRDAEQGAAEGNLGRSCRVQSALLNPAKEQFVSSGLIGLLSKVIVPFFHLILSVKISLVECRMTFQEFIG